MIDSRAAGHRSDDTVTKWMLPFLLALLCVDLAFSVLNVGFFLVMDRVPRVIYVDQEGNIPTWWSSAKLLLAGLILGFVTLRVFFVRPAARALGLLALLLLAMSVDETSGLHERAGLMVDAVLGPRAETPFHHTGLWFVVIGLPFAVIVLFLLRWLSGFLAEVPGARGRLLLGFAVLLAGATGVEALTNFVTAADTLAQPDTRGGGYLFAVVVEEFLEMAGGSIILWSSFGLARNHWSTRDTVERMGPLIPDT